MSSAALAINHPRTHVPGSGSAVNKLGQRGPLSSLRSFVGAFHPAGFGWPGLSHTGRHVPSSAACRWRSLIVARLMRSSITRTACAAQV